MFCGVDVYMKHCAVKCFMTDIIKPKTIALAMTIGTAFFSLLPIIITIGSDMRNETIGPTKIWDMFSCGSEVLKMINVTTTY